jgi:hypothetical protein
MDTKRFHLGDVLTVTTGHLLSPSGMEGVYKILSWLTGESVYTHQIPRALDQSRAAVLRQFPQLLAADTDGITAENHGPRLAELVAKHGEWFDVEQLPAGEDGPRDPAAELAGMIGKDRVIVVKDVGKP